MVSSGALRKLTHEKTRSKKSRDTVPLRVLVHIKNFVKVRGLGKFQICLKSCSNWCTQIFPVWQVFGVVYCYNSLRTSAFSLEVSCICIYLVQRWEHWALSILDHILINSASESQEICITLPDPILMKVQLTGSVYRNNLSLIWTVFSKRDKAHNWMIARD